MKRIKFLVSVALCTVLVLPAIPATASQTNAVVIPYEDAVQMALDGMLALQDIDNALRDMSLNRRFLVDEVTRITDHRQTLEMRAMQEIIGELQTGIFMMTAAQNFAGAATNAMINELNETIAGILTGVEGEEQLNLAMQAATGSMLIMAAPAMGGQIAQMEDQLFQLSREMERLNEDDNINELTRVAERNLNEFDRQADILRLTQEQAALGMQYALRTVIATLLELDLFVESLSAEIEIMEEVIRRTAVMHQLGMVGVRDLNAAELGLTRMETQFDSLVRGRQTLMQSLNQLLGLPLSQETAVSIELELPELPDDLERHIQTVLPGLHSVRQVQFELDSAIDARWVVTGYREDINVSELDRRRAFDAERRRGRSLWNFELTAVDERDLEIRERVLAQETVERAQAAQSQTLRTAETALNRSYMDIIGAVAQRDALLRELAEAQIEYETAKTNFELGNVTRFETEQARMAIFRVNQDLERLQIQKWLQAFRWENPSLLQ